MKRFVSISGLAVALTLALSGVASATPFVINQSFAQGVGKSDLPTTTIPVAGGDTFDVDPGSSFMFLDFTFGGGFGTFSTTSTQISGYYFLRSYNPGDVIGIGNFGDEVSIFGDWDTILVNGVTAGVWGASHSGFLGFRDETHHYGWIRYDFTRVNDVSTITLLDGATSDSVRTDIVVPGAPEPASLALLGLGVAGWAARRRRAVR